MASSGFVLPSYHGPALSLPAVDLSNDVCPDCAAQLGLCGRDHCRRQVLPLLKRPTGLLRLMGEAHVEQKDRQEPEPAEQTQVERIRRRNERRRLNHAARMSERRVQQADALIAQHIDAWKMAGGSFDSYDPVSALEWLTARKIKRGELPA